MCVCACVCFCSPQPANKQVCDDEADSLGFRAQESPCGSEHPLVGWSASLGPPVAEKPRWRLGRNTPTQLLPVDASGAGTRPLFTLLSTLPCLPPGLGVVLLIHHCHHC